MRTHLEFQSDLFPAGEGEEEEVNPGRWGKSLAQHLAAGLAKRGFSVASPHSEDWGWVVPIDTPEFKTFVGCGNYEEHPDGFLVFIEPSRPYVRRLWRKIPTEAVVAPLADALDQILRETDGVRELVWWPGDGPA